MLPDTAMGDFEGAFAAAPVKVDVTYDNAYQNHNPLEPHAAIAQWNDDILTAYVSQQNLANCKGYALSATLQISARKSTFDQPLHRRRFRLQAAHQYRDCVGIAGSAPCSAGPLKVAQSRPQMFSNTGHRPAFRQQIRLGADRNGRLTAIAHEVLGAKRRVSKNLPSRQRHSLGRSTQRQTGSHDIGLCSLTSSTAKRCARPARHPGLLVFESAMDELATALDVDPVELRLRNEPELRSRSSRFAFRFPPS